MKQINKFIIEKLKLNKNTEIKNSFTDEELRNDYQTVSFAYTKSEKEQIAQKYGVSILKIRDIQLVILDELRKNRNNKSEFTIEDVYDFARLDPPDGNYNKYVKYLEQESKEFIEYMLQVYLDKVNNISPYRRRIKQGLSPADRRKIRIIDSLKKYLHIV